MNFSEIQHTYHYALSLNVDWLTWSVVIKIGLLLCLTRVRLELKG